MENDSDLADDEKAEKEFLTKRKYTVSGAEEQRKKRTEADTLIVFDVWLGCIRAQGEMMAWVAGVCAKVECLTENVYSHASRCSRVYSTGTWNMTSNDVRDSL